MFSKRLSVQVYGESAAALAYFKVARPAVAKFVDPKPSFIQAVHQAAPEMALVLRIVDDSVNGNLTEAGGIAWARRMLALAKTCQSEPGQQFWLEGYNEVAANHANLDNLKKLVVSETAFARTVQAAGHHALVGGFSVGTPEIDDWSVFYPAMAVADGFHFHAYGKPGNGNAELESDWLLYRHHRWYGNLAASLRVKPCLVSELGIDGGLAGKNQSGWRDPAWKISASDYIAFLRRFNSDLVNYPQMAATLFIIGGYGWSSFEVSGPVLDTIAREQAGAPVSKWGVSVLPKPKEKPVVGQPKIIDITDQLPHNPNGPNGGYLSRSLSDITAIAIHHSAAAPNVSVEAIARYHVEHNQWAGIGYHFYILGDGTIFETNKLETISAHAFSVNAYAIGVCFAGDFTSAVPTDAQLTAGRALLAWLMKQFNIKLSRVRGHREWADVDPRNATECPGKQWLTGLHWKDKLLAPLQKGDALNIIWPVHGQYPITQRFGENPAEYGRFSYNGVPLKGHNGLDIGVPIGTPILACDDGAVIEIGEAATDTTGFGNYSKFKHAWGESLYGHQLPVNLRIGQTVKQGEQIGLSDNTGNSSGPHLHFQVRINPYNRADGWGGCVDPLPYLPVTRELEPMPTETSDGHCLTRDLVIEGETG